MKPFFIRSDLPKQLSQAGYSAIVGIEGHSRGVIDRYMVLSKKTAIKLLRLGKHIWCNEELQKYWYSK